MVQYDIGWRNSVCQAFGIPNVIEAWLDRFFEPEEFDLILALAAGPLSCNELWTKLVPPTHTKGDSFKTPIVETFLERAYKWGIINYGVDGTLELADFHARFEIWALFEGWKDIPGEVRKQLNAWEMAYYEARKRDMIENLKLGIVDPTQEIAEYLLLYEAEELLEKVEHVYLWPCNCRAMMGQCSKSLYTCLRFTNERGRGWEISRERAKEITREANRSGLMQLAGVAMEPDESIAGGLCNCCSDCCYPHLLAERLDSQKIWPKSRYVAHYQRERCTSCGLCVRRCPFQAFQKENLASRAQKRDIRFFADRCRGCGVCATGCPEGAIQMIPL